MASGHRRRRAEAVRKYVLDPLGLTQVPEGERGVFEHQANLINLAYYSGGGATPTFVQGQTIILSDEVSNADSNWSLTYDAGGGNMVPFGTGETGFPIDPNTKHYYMPSLGQDLLITDVSTPVIIYSNDGPQAKYSPYYAINSATGTASIYFDNSITGAVGDNPSLQIYVVSSFIQDGTDAITVCPTPVSYPNNIISINTTGICGGLHGIVYQTQSYTEGLRFSFIPYSNNATSTNIVPGWFIYVTGTTLLS